MNDTAKNFEGLTGWSATGVLKQGAGRAVRLQANFPKTDQYTVQFNRPTKPIPNAYLNTLIYTLAEIEWSVEGNTIRRMMSVQDGAAISGVGQAILVKVYDWSDLSGDPATDLEYQVDVLLTPGARATSSQPPILEIAPNGVRGIRNLDSLGVGSSANWEVPKNAGINSVWVNAGHDPAIAPPNLLTIRQLTDATVGTVLKRYNESGLNTWVALSPSCQVVRITNNNAAGGNMFVNVIWGIEG